MSAPGATPEEDPLDTGSPSAGPDATSSYDYDLPAHLIAQRPSERRDESRLMIVDRASGTLEHRRFSDLVDLIPPGDVLVVNDTRVFPARLLGRRAGGGDAEVLLLHPGSDDREWTALVRPGSKLRPGKSVRIAPELDVEILDVTPTGERLVRLRTELPVPEALDRFGSVPLPPYIGRPAEPGDRERYQTVYAREPGSVAAPTAGLHFTPDLLERIQARGVNLARLTLHVGVGTFRPVEVEDAAEHVMHREWFDVPAEAAAVINATRAAGGRVWAVGTTVVRTLETVAEPDGTVPVRSGWTQIFIRPPHRFRAVDRLVTNFHLPRSTLLMLVSAFADRELVLRAYREAVQAEYRFFSYGDAMLLV